MTRVNPQTLLPGTPPYISPDIGYLFFHHNWERGFQEVLEWKTDIIAAQDRTEQRIRLRAMPRRTFDLQCLVSAKGRRLAETWFGLRGTKYMLAPVWRDAQRLSTSISAGDTTVYVPTEHLDFAVGRLVAVWDAWNNYEIRAVTEIHADHIVVDAIFGSDWDAQSTRVAPCRFGLCADGRRVSRFTEDVAEYSFSFEALHEAEPVIAAETAYQDIAVCPFVPSSVDSEEDVASDWLRIDNEIGAVEYNIRSADPILTRDEFFLVVGRDNIATMLNFLHARAGRLSPFWLASNDRAFELAEPASSGATTITIEPIGYETSLYGSTSRTNIELKTTDGTVIRRAITAVAAVGDNEQLTLDSALPVDISAATLDRCAWLEQVRLDSDEITLNWVSWDCIELTLPVVVLS